MTASLRVLVVDDEPLARRGLARLAASAEGCTVVGECGDGLSAVAALDALAPDVVLLDVQMPELDGFGVLERARPSRPPQVIFVTAHDEHALRAFEVAALDYVLKPFEDRRLFDALARARESAAPSWPFVARMKGRRVLVRPEQVDWIEGAGYCAQLHAAGESHVVRETLDSIARRLDSRRFLRVHRGAIVHLERVVELRQEPSGAWRLLLHDGTPVPVSRSGRARLRGWIERARRGAPPSA